MANAQGPKLELAILLTGIDDVNSKLERLAQKITAINNANVKVSFDSRVDAVKKDLDKVVKDIQMTIKKINDNPIDFKVANTEDFDKFKTTLGGIDTILDALAGKATTLAEKMKGIAGSGKTLAMAAGTKTTDENKTKDTNAYANALKKLNEELAKLSTAKPIELKFDPTNINAIIGSLEHTVTKLNMVRSALGTALDLSKVKIPVPKKDTINVNDEYFKKMGESISQSMGRLMGKMDFSKQIKSSLSDIDFKGMADGINEALNKVYQQDKINKIPVVPTIDDATIKGLKTRITNLIKEIKESDGKVPLEFTVDLAKLRERLKVVRGELDRLKKTERFHPPYTIDLTKFKEKIKEAREALKDFQKSDEATLKLKVAISEANKVVEDFHNANSSLFTDKAINVTLNYSEFDNGIKHIKEALSSLKDMTIHINSNVKDVVAKERAREQELKEEAKQKKQEQQKAKEQKPAPDSKENYQSMLKILMAHPLSNGRNPEGNTTLGGRLKTVEMLQSAIELGKTNPKDPNAFLVGFKEEGYLRAQHAWLENAMHAVGSNMTVSQAQKAMKNKLKDPKGYNDLMSNLMAYPMSNGKDITTTASVDERLRQVNRLLGVHMLGTMIPNSPRSWTANDEQYQFLQDEAIRLTEQKKALSKGMTLDEYRKSIEQQELESWAREAGEEKESRRKSREENQHKLDESSSRYKREAQEAKDAEETRKATEATKEQERIDKENKAINDRTLKLNVQERFKQLKAEDRLKNYQDKLGESYNKANPMGLSKYLQLAKMEQRVIDELKGYGSSSNYKPVFGGHDEYQQYAEGFVSNSPVAQAKEQARQEKERAKQEVQQRKQEEKQKQQELKAEQREQREQAKQEERQRKQSLRQQQKYKNDVTRLEQKLKRIQQNYGLSLYDDKPMSRKTYIGNDIREQEVLSQLTNLKKKGAVTTNYPVVYSGLTGYNDYVAGYQKRQAEAKAKKEAEQTQATNARLKQNQNNGITSIWDTVLNEDIASRKQASDEIKKQMEAVAKVEAKLNELQQRLADSKFGDRPMKEKDYLKLSTKEAQALTNLRNLNGTQRASVYNGSTGYQQYVEEMRQLGKVSAEEEKRNALIQRRKNIAHEYSQELQRQNQLLQSGREISQKEIDNSERRINNIRRKWDNANWEDNETKPELRQSYFRGRNAQQINSENSVKNAMAWQGQYFSTANSKVGTLTASLEKLYTELKRNPGDSGLKQYINDVSKELRQAKKEAKAVQQNLEMHTTSITDGWKNKLSWIGGAFGFYESYDIAREFASTITEINEGMANLATVMPELHHSEQAMVEEQTKMIDTAAKYGATINDVIESARLWGRMYKEKDVPGTTSLLSEQSVKLAIADNFSLEESTKAVEAAMFQYGLTARSSAEALAYSNRIVDVYTKLSHSAGVSAQDLAAGVERSGSVAHQAGMDFEFLTSLIAQGTRSTALSGLTNNSPFMLETA